MYCKGLSTRNISDTIHKIYGFWLYKTTISKITSKVMPDISEFKTRKLDKIYVIVFVNDMRFKAREDGDSKGLLVYKLQWALQWTEWNKF